jgi:hypothetical protein
MTRYTHADSLLYPFIRELMPDHEPRPARRLSYATMLDALHELYEAASGDLSMTLHVVHDSLAWASISKHRPSRLDLLRDAAEYLERAIDHAGDPEHACRNCWRKWGACGPTAPSGMVVQMASHR